MTSVSFTAPSSARRPSMDSGTFVVKSKLYATPDSSPWAFDRNPGGLCLGSELSPVDPAMPRLTFAKKVHHVRYHGCTGRASTWTPVSRCDLFSSFTGITRTCCHHDEHEHGLVTTLKVAFVDWIQNMTALGSMVGSIVASTASRGVDQLPHACPASGTLLATVVATSHHRRNKVDVSIEDYVLSSYPTSHVYTCGYGPHVFLNEPSQHMALPGVCLPDLGTFAEGRNGCIADIGLMERRTAYGQKVSGASTLPVTSILALGGEEVRSPTIGKLIETPCTWHSFLTECQILSQSKERKLLPWEYGTEALLQVMAHAVLLLLLDLVAYSYKKGTTRWQCTHEYYCLLEDPG